MFKKVFLIIFLLFLLVGNHVLAPSKNFSAEIGFSILHPLDKMNNIAYAAEQWQSSKTANKVEAFSLSSYIVDRKSTRLNSSHVSISYAVFCLKKKNKRKKNISMNSCYLVT